MPATLPPLPSAGAVSVFGYKVIIPSPSFLAGIASFADNPQAAADSLKVSLYETHPFRNFI